MKRPLGWIPEAIQICCRFLIYVNNKCKQMLTAQMVRMNDSYVNEKTALVIVFFFVEVLLLSILFYVTDFNCFFKNSDIVRSCC